MADIGPSPPLLEAPNSGNAAREIGVPVLVAVDDRRPGCTATGEAAPLDSCRGVDLELLSFVDLA